MLQKIFQSLPPSRGNRLKHKHIHSIPANEYLLIDNEWVNEYPFYKTEKMGLVFH